VGRRVGLQWRGHPRLDRADFRCRVKVGYGCALPRFWGLVTLCRRGEFKLLLGLERSVLRTHLPFESFKLPDESAVRTDLHIPSFYDSPAVLYHEVRLVVVHLLALDQVGKHQRHRPGDSRHAVHQDLRRIGMYVGSLQVLLQEPDALLKILGQVVAFVVLTWNILVVGQLAATMIQVGPIGCRDDCFDSVTT